MDNVFFEGDVLWSQIDANQHMRHTAYADFAVQARLNMLEKLGLSLSTLLQAKIGPVLFKEELLYLREIGMNDNIKVTAVVTKFRPDASRWSIRHELFRRDGTKAAIVNVDGSWIDMDKRKLTTLPDEFRKLFLDAPRSHDCIEEIPEPK
ncbi:acyl-CoA thioesterase [Mucilaginibacter xinganensis]|uniref:Thioesterase n=1 Tax=Mucilaginibacter xinganensis TaxID=1234841 RepID=A0A223P4M3_9SPHI|nr:thioesterase family protein [Mucilaginibacter xinganensis]ASU36741.1 thioesterase [Mucilaginibacter xinganensis]